LPVIAECSKENFALPLLRLRADVCAADILKEIAGTSDTVLIPPVLLALPFTLEQRL
jgi:hypothetical protein